MMKDSIEMESKRLFLRNVMMSDLEDLLTYAGDYNVADTMNGSIPHPYSREAAQLWISKHQEDSSKSAAISWAISKKPNRVFIGSIQLRIDKERKSARFSYWLGKPFWNQGFASEAGKKVIEYGFKLLNLDRIEADHFDRNPSSGAVLRKLGFQHTGNVCKQEKLENRQENFEMYCLLKEDYYKQTTSSI